MNGTKAATTRRLRAVVFSIGFAVVGVALLCIGVLLLSVDRNLAGALEALGPTVTGTLFTWMGVWLVAALTTLLALTAAAARLRPPWVLILAATWAGLFAMLFYLVGGGLTYAIYESELAVPDLGGAIAFFLAVAGGVAVLLALCASVAMLAIDRSG